VRHGAAAHIIMRRDDMAEAGTLHDAFIDELRDTYDAEKQLTKALAKLAKASSNPKLRQAFESHLQETQGQITRLEQVFKSLDEKVRGSTVTASPGSSKKANRSWKRTSMTPRWTRA
jgi:ferritin-like metal-binding protein YciE